MKVSVIFAISLLTHWCLSCAAEAGWLIEHERFHLSVHGQLSCQDCHSDINEKGRHPDPVDVNRNLTEFFKSDQCLDCHEEVFEEIAEGSHAGEEATPWQRFDICIECHNPHYQFSKEDESSLAKLLSRPAEDKCSHCHDFQAKLPEFSDEDRQCMQCHQNIFGDETRAARQTAALCLHCHSTENKKADSFPLIDETEYASTPHQDVNCLVCHPQAAGFKHGDQSSGDCRQCHRPHHEKIAHDLHSAVSCGSCHLDGIVPIRDPNSENIVWRRPTQPNRISSIHRMQLPQKEESCRTCHTSGNQIGAAAMVLPAKSILCMPCHAATFSVGDTVTIVSLVLFIASLVAIGSVWFGGGDPEISIRRKFTQSIRSVLGAIFSSRVFAIVRSLIVDGLCQRRLFIASKERWLLHALVFYPFLFRFIWGIWALTASRYWPQWPEAWSMLDKNHPLTAFLFDLSGAMPIVGIIGMIFRRVQRRSERTSKRLPATDWPAYAMLGGIMLTGFVLEGMRMAMTVSPGGASYAFVGDAISRLLVGFELTGIYGYMWYLHAILTGAFVIYLPFSRMLHMVMAPIVLAMNAVHNQR